ncbi:hypothetical protein FOLKNPGA_02690 [Legionella sp. PC1000]|nr:hypothetical protein FOLKNPGA_02690 [Legionella sp. PC1000]
MMTPPQYRDAIQSGTRSTNEVFADIFNNEPRQYSL